ncbi:MAG TPA: bifunctional transaldolase/phosoglucose isomerase [Chloroflexia bacterium]|nr:bifunctional transaldolase/phosoglucose isomerase [Chloroflexia bacterium]
MAKNPMQQLLEAGQSPWLDNIRRGLLTSGELQRMIDEDGIVGVTANPTIFEKAISGSTDYDTAIDDLVRQGKSSADIYKILIIEDISRAADILRPVYDRTDGGDGYISIEVAPGLAHDTQGTINEAQEFWDAIKKPNIFIKIPATSEGIPAIEECLYRGINVNITLIVSVDVHRQVMEAYLSALERRVREGKPVDHVASVASFFVSRVDTKADKALEDLLKQTPDVDKQQQIKGLLGTTAINNSKLAYQAFLEAFEGDRWENIKRHGGRVQRPLWASTSTKNPNYRDVIYVEELIGPDTVNTMPEATVRAFKDHGVVARTIDKDLDLANQQLQQLEEFGISLQRITEELTVEGVESFSKSFVSLDECIGAKVDSLVSGLSERYGASLGGLQPQVDDGLRLASKNQYVSKIWEKDAKFWKQDDADAQKKIKNRLGWLGVVHLMQDRAAELKQFAQEIVDEGYTSVVLLGMGGSSLAPEVVNRVFGQAQGHPRFFMLDSTDPGTIEAIERRIDPATTLFIVATKSGGTTETMSFYRYFRTRATAGKRDRAGENFVAITDPGSSLETLAREEGFRRTFLNMPDIGGRYSALSYFGLVPAALMGLDIDALLSRAETMVEACAPCVNSEDNPGLWLGTVWGTAAREGRDKLTIFTSPDLDSFGLWAEQLIAESTGKEGKGLIPIAGEPVGRPSAYGADRLFVYLRIDGATDAHQEHDIQKLEDAGHPVVRLNMRGKLDLGAEFFRWEFATAVAGQMLGIDPFDEPNVQESKDNTQRLLDYYEQNSRLPQADALIEGEAFDLYADQEALARAGFEGTIETGIRALLSTAQEGVDYVAILAYMPSTGEHEELFQDARTAVRDTLRVATTFGYGPRFLHSTGQLHKGGPNRGIYIQVTAEPQRDVSIPGSPYSFGTLIRAQAMGDMQSLEKHGRRVIRLHVKGDHAAGVEAIREVVREAIEPLGI